MNSQTIDFIVLKEDDQNPFCILRCIRKLRNDFENQDFKTDIASMYLLSELLDKVEDSALIAIVER
jgi:hypothetical protein